MLYKSSYFISYHSWGGKNYFLHYPDKAIEPDRQGHKLEEHADIRTQAYLLPKLISQEHIPSQLNGKYPSCTFNFSKQSGFLLR